MSTDLDPAVRARLEGLPNRLVERGWTVDAVDVGALLEAYTAATQALGGAEAAHAALQLRAENAEQDRDSLRRDLARAGQAVAAATQARAAADERARELLEENARVRNDLLSFRKQAEMWEDMKQEARCANLYSHLEPDELQRVVAAVEARHAD